MKPVQEDDVVPARRIVRLTIAAVLMTALGTVLAWSLGAGTARQLGGRFVHSGPSEPPSERLHELRLGVFAARDAHIALESPGNLHSYGWVDRDAGVVRIPIDKAIDLEVAREARP